MNILASRALKFIFLHVGFLMYSISSAFNRSFYSNLHEMTRFCCSTHEIYPFQNLSLEFILKVFLRFRKFQPRYFYKIYSYRKKRVYAVKSTFFPKKEKNLAICLTHSPSGNFAEKRLWKLVERFPGWSLPSYEELLKLTTKPFTSRTRRSLLSQWWFGGE